MFSKKSAVRAILLAGFCVMPPVVQAQTVVKSSRSGGALARAIELHDSAAALYSQPARAADAARLHLKEVSFRSARDPESVVALIMAANLFSYAGQPITARKTMEQAAERALGIGDVVTAAQAYTHAAFFADKKNNRAEMHRLARKAILLSDSPLLDPEQRLSIRNRFRVIPTYAKLLK